MKCKKCGRQSGGYHLCIKCHKRKENFKTGIRKKYWRAPLLMTVKAWKKIGKKSGWEGQQVLCKRYDVILTDYKTTVEKWDEWCRKVNKTSLDNILARTSKGIGDFSKMMDDMKGSKMIPKQDLSPLIKPKSDRQIHDAFWGKEKKTKTMSSKQIRKAVWG